MWLVEQNFGWINFAWHDVDSSFEFAHEVLHVTTERYQPRTKRQSINQCWQLHYYSWTTSIEAKHSKLYHKFPSILPSHQTCWTSNLSWSISMSASNHMISVVSLASTVQACFSSVQHCACRPLSSLCEGNIQDDCWNDASWYQFHLCFQGALQNLEWAFRGRERRVHTSTLGWQGTEAGVCFLSAWDSMLRHRSVFEC